MSAKCDLAAVWPHINAQVSSNRKPAALRQGTVRLLALYFPQAFKGQRYSERCYAAMTKLEVVTRVFGDGY